MKIIFLLGPGGVGKTTISASIGVELSKKGKTFLLTIDPAKRLKSALKIPIDGVREISKNLFATQLNKKEEFVKFAEKHGLSSIVNTRLFEIAGEILPSDEYSAFLKIVELVEEGDFEFLVIDTPPSTKFISFLDAPRKILEMFETNSVRYFLEIAGRAGKRLSGPLSIAGRILGGDFIVEFAKFLGQLKTIFSEMQKISKRAEMILKSENTYLIGVSSPYPKKIDELNDMIKEIEKRKLEMSGIIINRFLDFTQDGIPINSPSNIVKFHSELVDVSKMMREEIKKIRGRGKIFVIDDYMQDVVSLGVLSDFSKKAEIKNILEEIGII